MNRIEAISGRAMELAGNLGDNVRNALPKAGQWLDTGVRLGALKTGAKATGKFVRRHPVAIVAAAAGVGLLWYAVRRRARQAQLDSDEHEALEGSARRVNARRATGATRSASRERNHAREHTARH